MMLTKSTGTMMMVAGGSGTLTVSGLSFLEQISQNAAGIGVIVTAAIGVIGITISIWKAREERRHHLEKERILREERHAGLS